MQKNWKRIFSIIFIGQAFSLIGSSAAQFAIIWWVTVETGSAMALTTIAIVGFLPYALIGPFAGVWVDRLNRKFVMMLADSLIAISSAVLALVFLFSEPSMVFIYIIAFIRGLGSTFHGPAMQSAIPTLVPESELEKVGGWINFISSLSNMAGPVLGAFLMGIISLAGIMVIDILGAAFAVITLLFVKIPDVAQASEENKFFKDLKDGLIELWKNKPLVVVTGPMLIASVVYMPLGALLPLLIKDHFNGTAWHNGICEFMFATGLLASSVVMGIWGGLKSKFLMISLAIMGLGLFCGIGGALPSNGFYIFIIFSFLMGCTGTFFNVPYIAYIQSTIAQDKMGKVISLTMSAMTLAMPIGLIVAGPISEYVGVAEFFMCSGILMFCTGIFSRLITLRYDEKDS